MFVLLAPAAGCRHLSITCVYMQCLSANADYQSSSLSVRTCRNLTLADNGAVPITHVINGKEHGGDIEIAWVLDDRNRYSVNTTNMAGEPEEVCCACLPAYHSRCPTPYLHSCKLSACAHSVSQAFKTP